jgi:hypothetical protein
LSWPIAKPGYPSRVAHTRRHPSSGNVCAGGRETVRGPAKPLHQLSCDGIVVGAPQFCKPNTLITPIDANDDAAQYVYDVARLALAHVD